ncbi:protein SOGA3-like [Notechis scutatus]|uniref:Protein SOGA3-like n=1 Tax=Notechis scutatus TaxID=8663 RepID=A0A6J1VBN6_9SAUR|nr:protein SOGA3-like [Notechis scutatus]
MASAGRPRRGQGSRPSGGASFRKAGLRSPATRRRSDLAGGAAGRPAEGPPEVGWGPGGVAGGGGSAIGAPARLAEGPRAGRAQPGRAAVGKRLSRQGLARRPKSRAAGSETDRGRPRPKGAGDGGPEWPEARAARSGCLEAERRARPALKSSRAAASLARLLRRRFPARSGSGSRPPEIRSFPAKLQEAAGHQRMASIPGPFFPPKGFPGGRGLLRARLSFNLLSRLHFCS